MFLLTYSLQFVKSSQFHSVRALTCNTVLWKLHKVVNVQFRIFETSEIQILCEFSESMTVNGALFDEIQFDKETVPEPARVQPTCITIFP